LLPAQKTHDYFQEMDKLSLSLIHFLNGDKDCPNFILDEIDKYWDYPCFEPHFLRAKKRGSRS